MQTLCPHPVSIRTQNGSSIELYYETLMKKYDLPITSYCNNTIMLTYAVRPDAASLTTALG